MAESNFPLTVSELSEEDREIAKKLYAEEFVQVGEKKWFTRKSFTKYGPEFYNFSVRSDDVWLLGYERSGTTVSQEIAWLICNNVDVDKAKQLTLIQRFPSLEHILFYSPEESKDEEKKISDQIVKSYADLSEATEKRFIKSHLPFSLLPTNLTTSGCKIIYLIREPKDVITSNYVIYEKFSKIKPFVEFPVFWDAFKKNLVLWGPYFEHLKEAWKFREHENVLVVFYDDLLNDQKEWIKKIAQFLGKNLSEENIASISEYCKKAFTKSPTADKTDEEKFVIETGKWKKYFIGALETEVEDWINENIKDTGICFSSKAENK
ncbi:sulfotransferase 1E1-like [Zophobas morio]|uniref:sulfotransferase 1E1-like n=1 Tax=Zophobas morio TaxID=2755281 RepID=UPI003082CEA0